MTFPRAWQNKIILRQLTEDEVSDTWGSSQLLVPESSKIRQTFRQWVIADVGDGVFDNHLLMTGLRVIIQPKAGANFEWENQTYKTVFETEIVAVFG